MDDREVLVIDLDYDVDVLTSYYNSLRSYDIDDIDINHKDEFCKNTGINVIGNTIKDLKKSITKKVHKRTDFVSKCDTTHPTIANIIKQLSEKIENDIVIGDVSFFLQHAGEDVPTHSDFPYRKNTVLMIPLCGISSSITYYEDGGEYQITSPTFLNITKRHGVKNVTENRLCLHFEIPNIPLKDIRLCEKTINI